MNLNYINQSGGLCPENNELILSLIQDSPNELFQYPEIISYIFKSNNLKLLEALDEQGRKDSDLFNFIIETQKISQNIDVTYYPIKDSFEYVGELSSFIHFEISENKKQLLQKIASNSDFSVKIKFSMSNHSFLTFENKEQEIANFVLDGHKKIITIAISGAILFSSISEYIKTINNDLIPKQLKSTYIDDMFFKRYGNIVREIEQLDNSDNLILALNELTQEDFNFINDLQSKSDLTDVQENHKEIIIDNLVKIMMSIQEERILYKTQKKIQTEDGFRLMAESIVNQAITNDLDYRLFASIIMQESKFDQGAISKSGDVALTQINYEIWKPEFDQMGEKLSKSQLKNDESYAIWAMGKILSKIRDRHQSDPYWYARYHSSTPSRKMNYASLVNSHYYDLNKKQFDLVSNKIDKILNELKKTNYQDSSTVDVAKLNSFVFQLINLKNKLDSENIQSRIAFNQ